MTGLPIHPHDGGPLAPHDLWAAWSREPAVIIGLGLLATLYAVGMARLRGRARAHAFARIMEAAAFWSGWTVLAVALISPLHRLEIGRASCRDRVLNSGVVSSSIN